MLPLALLLAGAGGAPANTAALLKETHAMTLAGRWDAALAALDAADAGAAKGGDGRSAAIRTIEGGRVLTERSFLHRKDPAPARAALEKGLGLATAARDEAAAAEAAQQLGRLEEAAAAAEKCGVTRALAAARSELSRRAAVAGDAGRAFTQAEQALAAARAYGAASEIRAAEALVGAAGRKLPN